MRDGLAKEEKQLLKERGRQERLAMSITDQMHTEAQVNEQLFLISIPFMEWLTLYHAIPSSDPKLLKTVGNIETIILATIIFSISVIFFYPFNNKFKAFRHISLMLSYANDNKGSCLAQR